jgi:hypothetical protein
MVVAAITPAFPSRYILNEIVMSKDILPFTFIFPVATFGALSDIWLRWPRRLAFHVFLH